MGLLSGALSFRRYQVVGELPPDFRDRFTASITKNAFRENDKARTKEDNIGWVSLTDPADTNLFLNKFLYNNFLVLTMRIDRKRVPARYLKIMVDRKVRETMDAKGLQRIGAAHKREIKEAVEEELLARALPVVATFDMAWEVVKGEVLFFGTSDAINDSFRLLFKETFGLEVYRLRQADWLIPAFSRDDLVAIADGLNPETGWRP